MEKSVQVPRPCGKSALMHVSEVRDSARFTELVGRSCPDCVAIDNIPDRGASLRSAFSLLSSGRRNTPTDGKGAVTAQASLRSSHPTTNPIRINKSSVQRNAHRAQPYPNASTITKVTSPVPCKKTKYVIAITHPPNARSMS